MRRRSELYLRMLPEKETNCRIIGCWLDTVVIIKCIFCCGGKFICFCEGGSRLMLAPS